MAGVRMRRRLVATGCALAALAASAVPARADMPYGTGGPAYSDPAPQTPNDLGGDGNTFKFAATPEDDNFPVNHQQSELCGVRGASVADAHATYDFPSCPPDAGGTRPVNTAWQVTTGRPDVAIAVLDSGLKWNDLDAMVDLRHKVRLNTGELPAPNADGPSQDPYVNCNDLKGKPAGTYDLNGDGVVNVTDYACDSRVTADPANGSGATYPSYWPDAVAAGKPVLDPEDLFIAYENRFGAATLYAVDNGALVVQEALGTLNNTQLGRQAVDYAYRHGVAVIASAADEAAQHHNYPSSLPHTIVVNSVRDYDATTTVPKSYLRFNGCTNFSSKISIAIPSTSCSSNATGLGAGMAGLVYSAALNARDASPSRLARGRGCDPLNARACYVTANEVRQLMASGKVGGARLSDD